MEMTKTNLGSENEASTQDSSARSLQDIHSRTASATETSLVRSTQQQQAEQEHSLHVRQLRHVQRRNLT